MMSVNVAFAMYASVAITEIFGYDSIGPLKLEELMIRFKTVNLPSIPKAIRNTSEIDMSFLHTFAWVVGLLGRAPSLSAYSKMKGVLKNLLTVGTFDATQMHNARLFKDGHTAEDIPLVTVNSMMGSVTHRRQVESVDVE
jgi:hypothetical protein